MTWTCFIETYWNSQFRVILSFNSNTEFLIIFLTVIVFFYLCIDLRYSSLDSQKLLSVIIKLGQKFSRPNWWYFKNSFRNISIGKVVRKNFVRSFYFSTFLKIFLTHFFLMIPLKTSENLWFSGVFREIKREHWEEMGKGILKWIIVIVIASWSLHLY